MGAETIDDINVNYEEDGVLLVRQVDKEILSRGSWTTIMFKYEEMDKASGNYKPQKVTIRRYQKSGGEYKQRSKFNFSSGKQAMQIVDVLKKWFPAGADGADEGEDE